MEYWDHIEEQYISMAIETVFHQYGNRVQMLKYPERHSDFMRHMAEQITSQAQRFKRLTESVLQEQKLD